LNRRDIPDGNSATKIDSQNGARIRVIIPLAYLR
jgi:hypothetical protein